MVLLPKQGDWLFFIFFDSSFSVVLPHNRVHDDESETVSDDKKSGGGGLRITTERAANEIGEQGRIGLGSKRQLIRDFEESGEEDEE